MIMSYCDIHLGLLMIIFCILQWLCCMMRFINGYAKLQDSLSVRLRHNFPQWFIELSQFTYSKSTNYNAYQFVMPLRYDNKHRCIIGKKNVYALEN
jgi:hypothetical protein